MSVNNDVFQLLPTKGNKTVLGAGLSLDDLTPYQIGVFNADTNLSVDGSTPVREIFLAVGIDTDGDGTVDDILTSAGQKIQTRNIRSYSYRPYTPARPMVIDIKDFKGSCDTEYILRLTLENEEIRKRVGNNIFTKIYSIKTDCCDGCEDCPSGDCNEVTKKFVEKINSDQSSLYKADYVDSDGGIITDIDAFIATNAVVNSDDDKENDVCSYIRITTKPVAVSKFCDINLGYYFPRITTVSVALLGGFECNGTSEVVQNAAVEEGSGYDLRQDEYHAGGWNGKPGPYRASSVTGMALPGFEYHVEKDGKYDVIHITYDQEDESGWLKTQNSTSTTTIVIPEADTATRDDILSVLDGFISPLGFDTLADDASVASTDPTVVEETSAKDDTSKDGIA